MGQPAERPGQLLTMHTDMLVASATLKHLMELAGSIYWRTKPRKVVRLTPVVTYLIQAIFYRLCTVYIHTYIMSISLGDPTDRLLILII
jgi:hypothetical protein